MRFVAAEDERDERGPWFNDSQTELTRKVICEGRSAELGDGEAAGGDNERGGGKFRCGAAYAKTSGGIALDLNVARVQDDFHAGVLALGKEHVEDGAGGVVAKELAKSFLVPGNAVAIDQLEEMSGLIERERGLDEVRISGEKAVGTAVNIGEVASAAAGDEDFAAGLRVVF